MRTSYWERMDKVNHNHHCSNFTCMQIRWQVLVTDTFFLCSFWRSLNCSILFTSSFSNPESWMWKFPTFSISNKKKKKNDEVGLSVKAGSCGKGTTCTYVLSFHPKMFSECCKNNYTPWLCRCVFERQLVQMEIINDPPDLIKAPSLAGDCDQLFAIFLLCRRSKKINKPQQRWVPVLPMHALNVEQPTSFSAAPPRLCRSVDRHWVAGW